MRQNSEWVASVSSQISQGNNDLSQRTEEQASALEETAASMERKRLAAPPLMARAGAVLVAGLTQPAANGAAAAR